MQNERNLLMSDRKKIFGINREVRGLFWIAALLWVMLIALAWNCEEPSKFHTIFVVFTVFILAVLIIRYAKRKGIITSMTLWTFIFLINLTLTLIVLQYLWIPSFSPHRAIGNVFDPILYDYYGKVLAEGNLDFSLVRGVYNYTGQILYIGVIYRLFGISTFYVGIFNALLSLITFLAITTLLVDCSGGKKYWRFMCLGMLFPEFICYNAIPGKEAIATCMMALFLLSLYKVLTGGKAKYILLLLLFSLGLIVVRASMLIAVLAVGGIWIIVKSKHKLKGSILYAGLALFVFLVVMPIVLEYTGSYSVNLGTFLNLKQKVSSGIRITPGEHSLNVMFASSNPIKALAFAPVRAIFYLVAPFPRLRIDWKDISWAAWATNLRNLSVWITLLCFPILIAATFQKSCRKNPLWTYITLTYWLLLLCIANGAFIIHNRYRIMADPFLIGTLFIGVKYGKPRKFILPSFILIVLGFALYYVLKQFA